MGKRSGGEGQSLPRPSDGPGAACRLFPTLRSPLALPPSPGSPLPPGRGLSQVPGTQTVSQLAHSLTTSRPLLGLGCGPGRPQAPAQPLTHSLGSSWELRRHPRSSPYSGSARGAPSAHSPDWQFSATLRPRPHGELTWLCESTRGRWPYPDSNRQVTHCPVPASTRQAQEADMGQGSPVCPTPILVSRAAWLGTRSTEAEIPGTCQASLLGAEGTLHLGQDLWRGVIRSPAA